jgi:hypothetical protein
LENYFNYFTEIEERFLRRRGGGLLLSTLDWALIETWKDAGIPLEAVLRGIDVTFEKYEKRPSKTRKINGLGFCAQEVLAAAEDTKEAALGASASQKKKPAGFQVSEIAAYLRRNAEKLEAAAPSQAGGSALQAQTRESASRLLQLAAEIEGQENLPRLEDLERRLTVLEEKLFAALLTAASDEEIVRLRAQADRELAPYRRKMPAAQIDQLLKQFIQKKLLEKCSLPRLSLFYM